MSKLLWLAALMGLGSAGSVLAEEVDFKAANPVLQSIVDAVTSADDLVDFAYPRFDEKFCDVKAEKLKYDLQGSLLNTPWLEGGTADVTATSTYVADRTEGHVGVIVTASGTVRSDILAMIRYAAYVAIRKTDHMSGELETRYMAHLKRLSVATSLAQVRDLLISGQQLAKDILAREIKMHRERLQCLEAGTCIYPGQEQQTAIEYQKRTVMDWEQTLPAYDKIKIEAQVEGGQVRKLTLSSPNMSEFILAHEISRHDFMLLPEAGVFTLTDTVATAQASGFHKMPLKELDELKTKLESNLIGVQNGNAAKKDEAQKFFRTVLIEFKKAIRGEF